MTNLLCVDLLIPNKEKCLNGASCFKENFEIAKPKVISYRDFDGNSFR